MKALIIAAVIMAMMAPAAEAAVLCKKKEIKRPGVSFVSTVCSGGGSSVRSVASASASTGGNSGGNISTGPATSVAVSRVVINR